MSTQKATQQQKDQALNRLQQSGLTNSIASLQKPLESAVNQIQQQYQQDNPAPKQHEAGCSHGNEAIRDAAQQLSTSQLAANMNPAQHLPPQMKAAQPTNQAEFSPGAAKAAQQQQQQQQ